MTKGLNRREMFAKSGKLSRRLVDSGRIDAASLSSRRHFTVFHFLHFTVYCLTVGLNSTSLQRLYNDTVVVITNNIYQLLSMIYIYN